MKKEEKTRILFLIIVLIILAIVIILVAQNKESNSQNNSLEKYYINEDPSFCERIKFLCIENYEPFSDETGCGCERK